ncbi:unnamed protein product [Leuciscus chuanchicus]
MIKPCAEQTDQRRPLPRLSETAGKSRSNGHLSALMGQREKTGNAALVLRQSLSSLFFLNRSKSPRTAFINFLYLKHLQQALPMPQKTLIFKTGDAPALANATNRLVAFPEEF